MGCMASVLSSSYDHHAETWQAPSKWHNQHDIVGIQQTGEQIARQYQNHSPVLQNETAYQQQNPRSPPVNSPPKAPRGFALETQESHEAIVERVEAEDEFPVERQIQQAPVNWSRGEMIGAGAFGRVYLALNNDSGELMAVKQVMISKEEAVAGRVAQHVRELEKEVNVLKQLDHPNIVRYLGTDRSKDCLNIFLEYVPGGSIASLLSKFGSFKETVIKIYARQILLGLQYLHAHKIMHRDIKGANILVDNTGLVKLADFGASKRIEDLVTIDSGVKSIKGTSYWMAPEVIKQTGHGRMADIWSVGCTIIEMATGKPPWSQFSSQVSAMFHIASAKGPPPIPEHLSADAKDFLLRCLQRIPSDRPNATTLLQHPFLAEVSNVMQGHAAPLANLATGPSRAHSPAMDEEKLSRKAKTITPKHLNASSAEFMKLYSPMADRMAEAAARSRPASTTGDKDRAAWKEEIGTDLPAADSQLRQSVASHASTRYEGLAVDDLLGSPQASIGSDSDFNPVEEPTWLQQDSLHATHFSYVLNSSPSDTPRIRAFGVEESTAVASPMRHQNVRAALANNSSMEEILSFVQDKARKDTLRLSVPFGFQPALHPEDHAARVKCSWDAGGRDWKQDVVHESKQQQWEAELEEELQIQRKQIRNGLL